MAHDLAAAWCESGGSAFRGPTKVPDEDYPPALESCDEIETRILGRVELGHQIGDESGEAGIYEREFVSVELRDLSGGPAPEWIAVLREHEGDSFEADRCHANTTETQSLVICGGQSDEFRCLIVPFVLLTTSTPRPADQLYDCETPARELEPETVYGYAMSIELEKDAVLIAPDRQVAIDEPRDAPYVGRVTLQTLFEDEPLGVP